MIFTKLFLGCFTLALLGQDFGFLVQNIVQADADINYEVHQELKTWNEANDFCQENGGVLAYIITYKEHKNIRKYLENQKKMPKDATSGYWLGGRYSENRWKWDVTQQDTRDDNVFAAGWHWREPNRRTRNGVRQECMELKYTSGDPLTESLAWNDMWCDERRGFICQTFDGKPPA